MRHTEEQIQKGCVKWFDYKYPSLRLHLHHSPNGGKRDAAEAAKFKGMGVRPGFPDLLLLYPNRFYPFMGIELKFCKGRQTANQKEYQRLFEGMGAKYVVCRSLDEFMREVDSYIMDC